MKLLQSRRGARNPRRQRTHQRGIRTRLSVGAQIHVVRSRRRCGLAKIESVDLATEFDDCKSAASEVPGLRVDHGKGEGGSHRGIGGIAPGP